MARRVFFSFHYDRDIRRVVQVRNSWLTHAGQTQPFLDHAAWERIRRQSTASVERWIDDQMKGSSVTAVLIGAETSTRNFVGYEIRRSHDEGKGLLGIRIHKIKDPQDGVDRKGANPFDLFNTVVAGRKVSLSSIYPVYDWVDDDGYRNMESWVEKAARAAGR